MLITRRTHRVSSVRNEWKEILKRLQSCASIEGCPAQVATISICVYRLCEDPSRGSNQAWSPARKAAIFGFYGNVVLVFDGVPVIYPHLRAASGDPPRLAKLLDSVMAAIFVVAVLTATLGAAAFATPAGFLQISVLEWRNDVLTATIVAVSAVCLALKYALDLGRPRKPFLGGFHAGGLPILSLECVFNL